MVSIHGKLEETETGGLSIEGVSVTDILCDLVGKEISISINNLEEVKEETEG